MAKKRGQGSVVGDRGVAQPPSAVTDLGAPNASSATAGDVRAANEVRGHDRSLTVAAPTSQTPERKTLADWSAPLGLKGWEIAAITRLGRFAIDHKFTRDEAIAQRARLSSGASGSKR